MVETPIDKKPECSGCGADDYDGDLRFCPYCESEKCSRCDMGDDVACVTCEGEEE